MTCKCHTSVGVQHVPNTDTTHTFKCLCGNMFFCEVDDENNGVSPGCAVHQIQFKVKIVEIVSHIRFSKQAGFLPNEPFGTGSLSGMGYC